MNIKFDPEIKKGNSPKLLHTKSVRRTYTIGFPTPEGIAPITRILSLNKKETQEYAETLMHIASLMLESLTDEKFWSLSGDGEPYKSTKQIRKEIQKVRYLRELEEQKIKEKERLQRVQENLL